MVDKPLGYVVFVLHSHLPWVLGHGRWPHGEYWLYEAAAECYVPLLGMLSGLAEGARGAHVTMGITPVLAESLASPRFKTGFLEYLEEREALAARDQEGFQREGDPHAADLAASWVASYRGVRDDFIRANRDLVRAFRRLQDAGRLEILTSAATHGYLPLLGRDACVAAQIRTGVAAHRRHFGRPPRGIWLPECAYRPAGPWRRPVGSAPIQDRKGLESFLAALGLRFFFVDTHLVAGGVPLGTYEDRIGERRLDATRPASGLSPNDLHALASHGTRRRIAVFARDPGSSVQVWSADYGYPGDGSYLEFHRKRQKDGLRYWRITDRRLPLEQKVPYDPEAAAERVQAHARHFLGLVRDTLRDHREATGRPGVVVAPFDTELFGHWWFEGPRWLEAVLRGLQDDIRAVTASEALEACPPRDAIALPEGSWGQGGHHWVWLNDDTRAVWELVYRAEDDFAQALASHGGSDRPEVRRILRQLARELLLLEGSDWPFLITTVAARDYAQMRFRTHYEAFERLLELLSRDKEGALGAEDASWLAELEVQDGLFPDLDPAWWDEGGAP